MNPVEDKVKHTWTVWACGNPGPGRCGSKGGAQTWEALCDELERQGLGEVVISRTGCSGRHAEGPILIVMNNKDEFWYGRVGPDEVRAIVREHLQGGRPVERLLIRPN